MGIGVGWRWEAEAVYRRRCAQAVDTTLIIDDRASEFRGSLTREGAETGRAAEGIRSRFRVGLRIRFRFRCGVFLAISTPPEQDHRT